MSTAVGSPSDDHRAAFRELVISHPVEAERVILGLGSLANRISHWVVRHVPPGSSAATRAPEFEALRSFLLRGDEIHANMAARSEHPTILGDPGFRTVVSVPKYAPAILKVESNSADEEKCRRLLVKIFQLYPGKLLTKAQLKKLFPDLGARPFERAFRNAVKETGAHAWSAAGRPRKANQDAGNRIASLINRDTVF